MDLHHKTYERVGEELLTDLVPLCRRCHQMVHALEQRGDIALDFTGFADPERAAQGRAYLAALAASRAAEADEPRAVLNVLPLKARIARALATAERDGIAIEHARARLYNALTVRTSAVRIEKSLRNLEYKVYGF